MPIEKHTGLLRVAADDPTCILVCGHTNRSELLSLGIGEAQRAFIDCNTPEMADRIVRACNSHDALVKHLQWALDVIEYNQLKIEGPEYQAAKAAAQVQS
jgi:hypothetical protein